jgi:deoxyribonuclease V
MEVEPLHRWDLSPSAAIQLQRELAPRASQLLEIGAVQLVAGTDVAYIRETGESVGAIYVMRLPGFDPVDFAVERCPTPFPYIPGLLSFREVPVLLAAFRKLRVDPDLVLVDGHGAAHPRRFGIACHLGLWIARPTVGVGKSLLCGTTQPLAEARGSWAALMHRAEEVGRAVRTRQGVRPVYVSRGFGLGLTESVEWVLKASSRFRLPEPIRKADRLAAEVKAVGAPYR